MNEAQLIDIAREAIMALLLVSAPPLIAGLITGLVISIFQTITQIQEMTLTFVPKVILVFGSLVIFLPFMLRIMTEFWHFVLDKVVVGGVG